jgi:hypothetical protein
MIADPEPPGAFIAIVRVFAAGLNPPRDSGTARRGGGTAP